MRAAPLPRCTVTGVTAVVSVPHVLGVPAAQPAAASVSARLGMGEDIVRSCPRPLRSRVSVRGLCDLILPIKFFGRP